jgi:hypothetical protein
MAESFENDDDIVPSLESELENQETEIESEYAISDEPELLSPAVPLPTEVELPTAEEHEIHLASTVCDVCLELNLTTKSVIKCERCEQAFCYHFCSAIDARYCVNCLSDLSVTKQVITKTYTHENPETKEISVYRRRAREIKIGGLDWLFAQRKIIDLSDVELDMVIEYHRNLCSLMIAESERRRNDRMHRYAGMKVSIPTPSTTTVSSSSTTTTTVKKTRTTSKNKQSEQLASILASLKAKGLSIEDIAKMVAGKK